MYPKAADVSMLVPSISHAQIPNPVKCKIPLQSPPFSRFQPKNYPLDSTKTPFNKAFREALHEVAVSAVRALVIRSEGENFCNGADVLEFAKLEPKIFRTLVNEVHSSFRLLESLRIP